MRELVERGVDFVVIGGIAGIARGSAYMTEDLDIADLTRSFLVIQRRFAAGQRRALGRGTHTKGVCCRATFEVFDLAQTIPDPALRARMGGAGRRRALERFTEAKVVGRTLDLLGVT